MRSFGVKALPITLVCAAALALTAAGNASAQVYP